MTAPLQCQSIVDEIDALEGSIKEVGELSGKERSAAIQWNARVRQDIVNARQRLNACVLAFGGGYATDVLVIDATPGGGTVTFPIEGNLWTLTSAPPVHIERQTVQSGRLSFVKGQSTQAGPFAISIDEPSSATFTGPLFRSRSFPTLPVGTPANPTGQIEILVLGPVPVSSAAVTTLFAGVALPAVPSIAINSVTLTLGAGSITIVVGGAIYGIPVNYAYECTLTPSHNMSKTGIVCDVASRGTLSTPVLTGFAGIIFTALASVVEPLIRAIVTDAVQTTVNAAVAAAAATAIGRPLTPFETISMRRIVVLPSGIVLFPTIGRYGP